MGALIDKLRQLSDEIEESDEICPERPTLIRQNRLIRAAGSDIEPSEAEHKLAECLTGGAARHHYLGAVDLVNQLHAGDDQWWKWSFDRAVVAACRWWNLELDQMTPIHWVCLAGYMAKENAVDEVRAHAPELRIRRPLL